MTPSGWYLTNRGGVRRYGVRFGLTWPHISLGLSAHIWPLKFAHLSLHLPFGWLTIGHVGLDGING